MKIYVDNIDVTTAGSSAIMTGSIITTADLQVSGRDGNNNLFTGIIDEVIVYDRELTPAEISIRWNGGAGTQILPGATTSYPTDNPGIISKTKIKATELKNVSATINNVGLDAVKFVLEINGTNYWYNSISLNWEESTGYLETNTISEINGNLSSLDLTSSGSFITLVPFLHSEDGSTTPEISELNIDFDFFVSGSEDINFCSVYWYARNSDGSICTDKVYIIPSVFNIRYKDNIFICQKKIIETPDLNTGYVQFDLIENINMIDINGNPVTYGVYQGQKKIATISVPEQPSALLWDIII